MSAFEKYREKYANKKATTDTDSGLSAKETSENKQSAFEKYRDKYAKKAQAQAVFDSAKSNLRYGPDNKVNPIFSKAERDRQNEAYSLGKRNNYAAAADGSRAWSNAKATQYNTEQAKMDLALQRLEERMLERKAYSHRRDSGADFYINASRKTDPTSNDVMSYSNERTQAGYWDMDEDARKEFDYRLGKYGIDDAKMYGERWRDDTYAYKNLKNTNRVNSINIDADQDAEKYIQKGKRNTDTAYLTVNTTDEAKTFLRLDDEQKRKFNYLVGKYGYESEEAKTYLDQFIPEKTKESMMERQQWIRDISSKTPIFGAAATMAGNIAGAVGTLEAINQTAEYSQTGKPINPYAGGFGGAYATKAATEGVRERNRKIFGNSNIVDFFTDTGLSVIQSFARGIALGPAAGGIEAGLSAAQSAYIDYLNQGVDPDKALLLMFSNGINEMLFETVSLENWSKLQPTDLIKNWKVFVKNVAKQSFTEGSEEFFTEISNHLADSIILGENSAFQTRVDELVKGGKDRNEAMLIALGENLKEDILAGAGGMVSGLVMGGAGQTRVVNNLRQMGSDISNTEDLTGIIEGADDTTQEGKLIKAAAEKAKAKLDSGQRVTTGDKIELGSALAEVSESTQNNAEKNAEYEDLVSALKSDKDVNQGDYKLLNDQDFERAVEEAGRFNDTVADLAKGFGNEGAKVFTELARRSDADPVDIAKAAMPVYNGQESGFTEEQRKFAIKTIGAEGISKMMYASMHDGNDGLSKGGLNVENSNRYEERDDSLGRSEYAEESAERSQPRYNEATGFRNDAENQGWRKVKSEFLIPAGTANKDVSVAPAAYVDSRPELKAIRDKNKANGHDTVFVVGNLEVDEGYGAFDIRGWISDDGKTKVLRIDHPMFSAEQLDRHEQFHAEKKKNPRLITNIRNKLALMPEEKLEAILTAYAANYQIYTSDADYILEEVCADAYADMDIFEGTSLSLSQVKHQAEEAVRQGTESVENAEKSPKFSRETMVNGKSVVYIENSSLTSKQLSDPNEVAKFIASHTGEVYRNIETGYLIRIGDDLPREYTRSKYSVFLRKNKSKLFKAKNKVVDGLGLLIETATNKRWESTKHPLSKDAKYGMYRFDGTYAFEVKDAKGKPYSVNAYDVNLLIRNASDGNKYLYDITDINENTALAHTLSGRLAAKNAAKQGSTSSDNISPSSKKGKNILNNVGVEYDQNTESVNPGDFSRDTWNASDYVINRTQAAKELAAAIGISQKKARDYIDMVNSVAKSIADDMERLDYIDAGIYTGESSFVSNVEYGGSIDFNTLCKKRRLLTGTFEAIQNALPNTALTANEILDIRDRMDKAGLEVSCGKCYVEGSRANMGLFTQKFIELYKKYNPGKWAPTLAEANTPDGLAKIRIEHPEVYEQYEYFWNHYGTLRKGDPNLFASQQKPKLYQMRTAYKNEIIKNFSKDASVESKNRNGGIRFQSFSDFEIVHLIDAMQVIMDMSKVGLNGQAYTKVPEFALALGNTGLKINLSIDAWGVDENGNLVFNDKEGMNHETAFDLRNRFSKNVGTICCVYDDAQLMAALKDDRIDFIIPFHRSQWKKAQYKAMGLPSTTKDYTFMQNEKWLNPKAHTHTYQGREVATKCTNYMPNEYWDFGKSGKQNAEAYLDMCARDGKRPKFYKLLDYVGSGRYALKADGSTDGYWKLLIDFKMYDNSGKGSPQMPVRPDFNMDEVNRMLEEYKGGAARFPVAQGIVDEFVADYKKNHPGQRYSRDTAPTFYSQMSKTIDGIKQDKIGANSVISYLKGRGVKDEEIKWSGIEEFLDGKKSVSKSDLQEFAAGSTIQIEEESRSGKTGEQKYNSARNFLKNVNKFIIDKDSKFDMDLVYDWFDDSEQFDINLFEGDIDWAIQDGSIDSSEKERIMKIAEKFSNSLSDDAKYSAYTLEKGKNYREVFFKIPGSNYTNGAMDTHWGENGVLAHARIQDMKTKDGDKMLFVEEIQSDWHNEGKKSGYAGTESEGTVPNAPFKNTYTDFVMKRMIREAAEKGYDSLGWTTGKIQEDRWSDEFAEGYRIEYDQDIPKFLNKYGKKWGASVDKTTLANGEEVWRFSIPESMKESVLYEGQPMYSRDVEYSQARIDELVKKYGAIERGENAVTDYVSPRKTSDNKTVRRYTRTVGESGILSEDMTDELKKKVLSEAMSYVVSTDKAAENYANSAMAGGEDSARKQWDAVVNGNGAVSKYDIALGEKLLMKYAENGDTENVLKMTAELAEEGTRSGQAIQAMRLLKKWSQNTPAVGAYYIQKTVDQMNKDLRKKYKGKKNVPQLKIDKQLLDDYLNAKTPDTIEAAEGRLYQDLANQLPSTIPDKLRAWRYLSMLGNPRTHIRNIVGNAVFVPAVKMKNVIKAGLESVVGTKERTASIRISKEYRAFAENDFKEMESILSGNTRQDIRSKIEEKRKIWKDSGLGKVFNFASEKNSWALEKEDAIFLKHHYISALSQYLTANNIDVENDQKGLSRARKYAINEAQKATYRDASAAADALNRFSKVNKVTEYLIEGALPFKKTPINILKRGIEYSPVGLIKTLSYGTVQLKNGTITVNDYLDGIASGTTGLGIAVIGALLSSLGIITGNIPDDDEDAEKLAGAQEYSVNIGGYSYTIDWAAPASLPFFIGAEVAAAMKEERGLTLNDWIGTLKSITEPMFNLSMLSGLNDTIEAVSYSDQKLTALGTEVVLSYLGQFVPTVFGQIARTVDTTRRINYVDKNLGIPDDALYFIEKMQNKIPGLSFLNNPYVNQWGEQDKSGRILAAFENFISPGYISKLSDDKVNAEVQRLNGETDKNVIPPDVKKYFGTGENRIDLTSDQYTEYKTVTGKTAYNLLDNIIADERYNNLTMDEQAQIISYAYDYAKYVGRKAIQPEWETTTDKWMIKAKEGFDADGTPVYEAIYNKISSIRAESSLDAIKAENGIDKWDAGQKEKEIFEMAESNAMTKEEAEAWYVSNTSRENAAAYTAWMNEGNSTYDYIAGKSIDSDLTEVDPSEKYTYVVNSKDYTKEQKVAWFKSDSNRTDTESYKKWKSSGGVDYDYIVIKSKMENFSGDDKQKKIAEYVISNAPTLEKAEAYWLMEYGKKTMYVNGKDSKDGYKGNFKKLVVDRFSEKTATRSIHSRTLPVGRTKTVSPGTTEVKKGAVAIEYSGLETDRPIHRRLYDEISRIARNASDSDKVAVAEEYVTKKINAGTKYTADDAWNLLQNYTLGDRDKYEEFLAWFVSKLPKSERDKLPEEWLES